MNKRITILMIITMLMCGCVAQQGRLAVVDLDFRKPAQLEAGAREAEAPYKDWAVIPQTEIQNEVKKESLPIAWWDMLFNLIAKLECRLTLVQLEWADHRKAVINKAP